MCNLYSMTRNREAISRLFRVPHNRATAVEPLTSIFPGYQAPVVRQAADGERELVMMSWGFVLLQKTGRTARHQLATTRSSLYREPDSNSYVP